MVAPLLAMAGPIPTVDQQDVGPAVVVIVNEGATRTHGFGQPFLAEGAVIVGEMDSGLGGDVAEGDVLLGSAFRGHQQNQ